MEIVGSRRGKAQTTMEGKEPVTRLLKTLTPRAQTSKLTKGANSEVHQLLNASMHLQQSTLPFL